MRNSPARPDTHALVVATCFPPDAAIGTMRTLRLVRHLCAAGWSVDVLTLAPETYRAGTATDAALLARVPDGVRVTRVKAWRRAIAPPPASPKPQGAPATAAAGTAGRGRGQWFVVRAVRAMLRLPDVENSWWLPAVLKGLRLGGSQKPSVIYSSGPPFTSHLVALALSRLRGVPWVADFRDPWARAPWRDDRFGFEKRTWQVFERLVVRHAHAVLFATPGNKKDFSGYYGAARAARFHVVQNGCEIADVAGLTPSSAGGPFVLLHAGSLYGARNPAALLHAVARAIERGAIRRDDFRLRFIGKLGGMDAELRSVIAELRIGDVVELVPYMERRLVLQQMVDAAALLIIQPVTTVSIPGKLYEYLAARRPVFGLVEPAADTADVIRRSPGGIAVAAEDAGAIEQALVAMVSAGRQPMASGDASLYDGAIRAAEMEAVLNTVRRAPAARPAGVPAAAVGHGVGHE